MSNHQLPDYTLENITYHQLQYHHDIAEKLALDSQHSLTK